MTGEFDDKEDLEEDPFPEEEEKKPKALLDLGVHEDDELEPLAKVYTRLSDRGLSVIETDREAVPAVEPTDGEADLWPEAEEKIKVDKADDVPVDEQEGIDDPVRM